MPDLVLPDVLGHRTGGPDTAPPWASRDLSARVARLAHGIADVLDERCTPGSGVGEAAEFLRSWADVADADPLDEAGSGEPGGFAPLDLLAARYGLTAAECDLLLLAGLPDEHEGLASTLRALHPHGEPRPTAGLAALVLAATPDDRRALRGLLSAGAAVRHGLLRMSGPGTLFERTLTLADALWEALHGFDAWPTGLPRVAVDRVPPGLTGWLDDPRVRRVSAALRAGSPHTVLVSGADEPVALARCAAVAAAAGVRVVGARLAGDDAAALLATHAAVRGAVPLLVVDATFAPVLPDVTGPAFVFAEAGVPRVAPDRPLLTLPLGPVAVADQRVAWRAAVPHLAEHASTLAARHPLDPAITAQVALDSRAHGADLDVAAVSALVRARAGAILPSGVDLVTPDTPWQRLVLPEEGAWQLRDAVNRLDHQALVLDDWGLRERANASRGARLLFTGPPGTGKSLAAAAVATAAGTDLLVVDMSRVVSKWLGETEKNLAAAFAAAERTQAVLLLDEADALFGTRTEISDAHDRYANLETAYLLQRLDHFEGIAVLTTNLRANIDSAFVRRMDFVVEFPLPDAAARAELWALHLPAEDVVAPDVDVTALARRYPVPGGWIRNAAVGAAFVAAAAGDRIGLSHLVAAMRREYAKAAMPFPGDLPRRRHDDVR
jgi:hypothetical protein